jgi:DNA-binding MarR family transcriptional regulator
MTQAQVIQVLQNGPLTSRQIAEQTGMNKDTVLSTAKKLRYQGKLTTEQVKDGNKWVAKYTLADHMIEELKEEKPWDKNNPFDWRNAKGIFTPTEYRTMKAQANQLFRGNPYFTGGITSNQSI